MAKVFYLLVMRIFLFVFQYIFFLLLFIFCFCFFFRFIALLNIIIYCLIAVLNLFIFMRSWRRNYIPLPISILFT